MNMDQMAQLRANNDIVAVVGAYLKLEPAGKNFTALCPFHSERTPSFNVNPYRQIWHCFGCHRGGDIFSFVQRFEKVSFEEAVQILQFETYRKRDHVEVESGFIIPDDEESPTHPNKQILWKPYGLNPPHTVKGLEDALKAIGPRDYFCWKNWRQARKAAKQIGFQIKVKKTYLIERIR